MSTALAAFTARWEHASSAERSNSQSFLKDLCVALGVPEPEPAVGDPALDTYVFELPVRVHSEAGCTRRDPVAEEPAAANRRDARPLVGGGAWT